MLGAGQARERDPQPDPPSRATNGCHAADVGEQDRESLARARPGVTAEREHPEQRHVRVEGDRERERPRVGGVGVAELERDECEEVTQPG